MAVIEPYIGGNHIQDEPVEQVVERLRSNRAILVLPMNERADESARLHECRTTEEAFRSFKPRAGITVTDHDGSTSDHDVSFHKITDFSPDSVVESVPILRGQREEIAILTDLRSLLKDNPRLRRVIDDPVERGKLLACLQQALTTLEG